MKLVIAEKPSVAQSIAKVLKATTRKDGYIQNDEYIISWCVGHLIRLADPDIYNEEYKKWRLSDLPFIPVQWLCTVSPDTQKQFNILSNLMHDNRVTELVCATDAGREGELIFRWVYDYAKCQKPFQRLWISSMEDTAIRNGFDNLKDGHEYDNLYESAKCRAQADWMVGINSTRLYSVLYHSDKPLNIGRVQSPTLAMLVERESQVQGFKKEKYFNVHIRCEDVEAVSERIPLKAEAEQIQKACHNQQSVVTSVQREEKTINPPKLYDLTTLQREANRLYGYTAKQTLDRTQELYEKKLVTYPRTDSQYLTEDMAGTVETIISIIANKFSFVPVANLSPNLSRITDNNKVSDHHAIIPTAQISKMDIRTVSAEELNILSLISQRLLCAVADKHTFETVTASFECAGNNFTAKGKTTIQQGWKEIEKCFRASIKTKDKDNESEQDKSLPPLSENQIFESVVASVSEHYTSPPKRYTEDTLLSAMETAGNEDIDKGEDVEKRGLGTPATRAATIESLVTHGFVTREKKQIVPTPRGINLISILPGILKSAKLTAEWENALAQIARDALPAPEFMSSIEQFVRELIETHSVAEDKEDLFRAPREVIGICPRCGKNVYEGKLNFYCENKGENKECGFTMWKNDYFFTNKKKELGKNTAIALLKDGKTNVIKGLYSKKNDNTYDAIILLADEGEGRVKYELEFVSKNKASGN